jgi:hypothetical protein
MGNGLTAGACSRDIFVTDSDDNIYAVSAAAFIIASVTASVASVADSTTASAVSTAASVADSAIDTVTSVVAFIIAASIAGNLLLLAIILPHPAVIINKNAYAAAIDTMMLKNFDMTHSFLLISLI